MYHDDPIITKMRLEKLGMKYILLDINAATIDRDPERRLTQRYEDMLKFVAMSDIELIETDSTCLKVALDSYKRDNDIDKFLDIATVNYSYKKSSDEKRVVCVEEIVTILWDSERLVNYPYLTWYLPLLEKAGISLDDTLAVWEAIFQSIRNGYKVLFKIN